MPVNTQHADYTKFLPKWNRCKDTGDGEAAVHLGAQLYLPMLPGQESKDYTAYVLRAPFYNATWRTIVGLVGMVFRKPPKIDAPQKLQDDLLSNVDGAGQPFQSFMKMGAEHVIRYGRVAVLVDYPQAPAGITMEDAKRLNLRPTMQLYDTFSVINWRTAVIDNKKTLVLAVLKESEFVVDTDGFGGKDEDRWRVLDLVGGVLTGSGPLQYRQRLYKLKAEQAGSKEAAQQFEQIGPDIYPKMSGKPIPYITLQIMGIDGISDDIDEPPLIDLVDMNLSHYRTSADLEHGCHFTALPTLFLAGFKSERDAAGNAQKVYLGAETAIVCNDPNAKATFCEFTGQGLSALEKNLARKEGQMAVLGARMLEPQIRGVESAEVASIHRKGEESVLSAISQTLSLGFTAALAWFIEWAAQDPANTKVELNRDFYPQPMTAQMLLALITGWQQGVPGLSDQGIFEQLKAGEIVSEDTTLEDEQARITQRQQELADQNAEALAAAGGASGGNDGATGGPGSAPATGGMGT